MLKDITLGQFFPGTSLIHRLDPRTKLVMLVVYIVALFTAQSWISYGIMFGFLALCIAISRIRLKSIVRGLKPMVVILVLTGILNVFLTAGETVWLHFWVITVTKEGVPLPPRCITVLTLCWQSRLQFTASSLRFTVKAF